MDESDKAKEPVVLEGRFKINSIRFRSHRFVYYNGFDSQNARPVFIKTWRERLTGAEQIDAFKLHVAQMRKVNLANIEPICAEGVTEQGAPYIVFDSVDGKTVLQHCRELMGQDKEELVISLFGQFSLALQSLHSRNLAAGPLSEENLWIANDFQGNRILKISNWGDFPSCERQMEAAALELDFDSRLSPEINLGLRTDSHSDIYELGCLLYECLVGHPYALSKLQVSRICRMGELDPLMVADRSANVRSQLESEPLQRDLIITGNESMDKICSTALQLNPKNRYQTCLEFHDAILNFLNEKPTARKTSAPRRQLTLSSVLALLGVLGAVVGANALASLFSSRNNVGTFNDLSSALSNHAQQLDLMRSKALPSKNVPEPQLQSIPTEKRQSAPVRVGDKKPYLMYFPFSLLATKDLSAGGATNAAGRNGRSYEWDGSWLACLRSDRERRYGTNLMVDGPTPFYLFGGTTGMESQGRVPDPLPKIFSNLPDALDPPANKRRVQAFSSSKDPNRRFGILQEIYQPGADEIYDLGSVDARHGTLELGPGDYVASQLIGVTIVPVPDQQGSFGPIRIFIQGDKPDAQNVIQDLACGARSQDSTAWDCRNMQIWYNGSGCISYSGINDFHGIIYAPKATFQTNGINNFYGGIIVAKAKIDGITGLYHDSSLSFPTDWNAKLYERVIAPPALAYAVLGLQSVSFQDDSKVGDFEQFNSRGRVPRRHPMIASFGELKEPMLNNGNGELTALACHLHGASKSIPMPAIPNARVVSANLHEQKVYQPVAGEIVDLKEVEDVDRLLLGPGDYTANHIKLTRGQGISLIPDKSGKMGTVRIFLTGKTERRDVLELDDAGLATNGNPDCIQILYSGSKDITLSGNSTVHGVVYAPAASIYLKGSSKVVGAVVAKRFEAQNTSSVLYQRSLASEKNWGYGTLPGPKVREF